MTDIKVPVPSFGKEVTLSFPGEKDVARAFAAAAKFIQRLEAENKLADQETGIHPKGATYEIVPDGQEGYRLRDCAPA